ncbi:MAG: ATP-dependent helicase [Planctomycetota bacterium]
MGFEELAAQLRAARRKKRDRPAESSHAAVFSESVVAEAKATMPEPRKAEASPRELFVPKASSLQLEINPEDLKRLAELELSHPKLAQRLKGLNPQQLRVVFADDAAAVVEAQVGSGKTTVLIEKILYLHLALSVPLAVITVMTFTNKAARELQTRLAEALPGVDITACKISTFHGMARRLLSFELDLTSTGYRPSFTILTPGPRRAMLNDLAKRDGMRICYQQKIDRRLEAYRNGRDLYGNMKKPDDIGKLRECFVAEKIRQNVMDFDDLIEQSLKVMPSLAAEARPAWIIVDEYQDSDPRQIEFVRALAADHSKILAVGDPRQVIYSWRGSRAAVFDEFRQRFDAVTYDLSLNYRSRATILEAASCVLGRQAGRIQPTREGGDPIVVRRHHDAFQEGLYLAKRIEELREAEGIDFDEIAILVRTKDQVRAIVESLEDADIPLRFSGTMSTAERPALGYALSLLRCASNARDFPGFIEVLLDPKFGVLADDDQVDRSRLKQLAISSERATESSAERILALTDEIPQPAAAAVAKALAEAVWSLIDDLNDEKQALDVDALFSRFGFQHGLKPRSSAYPESCRIVREVLRRLVEALGGDRDSKVGLSDFVAMAAMGSFADDAGFAEQGRDESGVSVMTLHAAKGLEFDYVFMSGLNRGMMPLAAARTPAQQEEEQRLLFVGLTRAREQVELSWLTNPPGFSGIGEPSPYLSRIPKRLLDRQDLGTAVAEALTPHLESKSIRSQAEVEPPKGQPWRVGLAVTHPQYGPGVITKYEDSDVDCLFDKFGSKRFNIHFCSLVVQKEQGE